METVNDFHTSKITGAFLHQKVGGFLRVQLIEFILYTANEGLVRILYKFLVPIDIFPEMKLLFTKQNYNVLSPSSYTQIPVRD